MHPIPKSGNLQRPAVADGEAVVAVDFEILPFECFLQQITPTGFLPNIDVMHYSPRSKD
jgi:hypothetical protein